MCSQSKRSSITDSLPHVADVVYPDTAYLIAGLLSHFMDGYQVLSADFSFNL